MHQSFETPLFPRYARGGEGEVTGALEIRSVSRQKLKNPPVTADKSHSQQIYRDFTLHKWYQSDIKNLQRSSYFDFCPIVSFSESLLLSSHPLTASKKLKILRFPFAVIPINCNWMTFWKRAVIITRPVGYSHQHSHKVYCSNRRSRCLIQYFAFAINNRAPNLVHWCTIWGSY